MSSRRWWGMGALLLACGGKASDETLLLPQDRDEPPPQTGLGAQQPRPSSNGLAPPGASAPATPASMQALPGTGTGRCEPGSSRCSGSRREACSAAGNWLVVEQCAGCNGFSYCLEGPQGASCTQPICCYPEMRCDGSVLEQCNRAATGYDFVKDCGTGALCDALRGACTSGCVPGEERCEGSEARRCNADGTAFETLYICQTAALCSAQGGKAYCNSGCAVGELRCYGTTLARCNADATAFVTVMECPAGCDTSVGGCVEAKPQDAGVRDAAAGG